MHRRMPQVLAHVPLENLGRDGLAHHQSHESECPLWGLGMRLYEFLNHQRREGHDLFTESRSPGPRVDPCFIVRSRGGQNNISQIISICLARYGGRCTLPPLLPPPPPATLSSLFLQANEKGDLLTLGAIYVALCATLS